MARAFSLRGGFGILAVAIFLLGPMARARGGKGLLSAQDIPRKLLVEKSGNLVTRPGGLLRLETDRGDVVIHTHDAPEIVYKVRVESLGAQNPGPGMGALFDLTGRDVPGGVLLKGQSHRRNDPGWMNIHVTFDVTMPRDYGVDIFTQAGSIQAPDLRGRVTLVTGGGNIFAGNIHGSARLQTGGGHIGVKDVSGNLDAETGGGFITAGKIGGLATLHTDGGHIHVASVSQEARLETGGGNISLGHSGKELLATTAGGQIDVGEASGSVRAVTGGGGIRLVSVKGPTDLETGSGSIYLSRVASGVRAQTRAGAITAWLGANTHLSRPCVFESGRGDIVVYVPVNLPLTIDATVQRGDERHIYVDPSLPLKISTETSYGNIQTVHAEGALNGGGELLRLRTTEGKIRLLLNDVARQAALSRQQMEELQKQLREQLKAAQQAAPANP